MTYPTFDPIEPAPVRRSDRSCAAYVEYTEDAIGEAIAMLSQAMARSEHLSNFDCGQLSLAAQRLNQAKDALGILEHP